MGLERMADLCDKNFANATELANYLVLRHDVPFREAHHVVGSLVGELSRAGENFSNFDRCYEHLKESGIDAPQDDIRAVLDPKSVMLSYNCIGGTGNEAVTAMINEMYEDLKQHRATLEADNNRVTCAMEGCRSISREAASVGSPDELQ